MNYYQHTTHLGSLLELILLYDRQMYFRDAWRKFIRENKLKHTFKCFNIALILHLLK